MANKPEFDPHKSANLLATINANVDNDKLSDADFRQFIRNSIPVAIISEEKANCDYSVYNKIDGTTTYKRFLQESPMFNSTPKQMQESAEYIIAGWNYQSPNNVYTLERRWWNGER